MGRFRRPRVGWGGRKEGSSVGTSGVPVRVKGKDKEWREFGSKRADVMREDLGRPAELLNCLVGNGRFYDMGPI